MSTGVRYWIHNYEREDMTMTETETLGDSDEFLPTLDDIRAGQYGEIVAEFVHADGSHTFIVPDPDPEHANPRDNDGNVAHLVMVHRDWRALDAPDSDIDDARSRWGEESELVGRYVAMFRPDIAHYEARWEVTGYSQSDWAYGYGYVLADDMRELGAPLTRDAARQAFDAEVHVYGQHFRGDVYGAVHVRHGSPIVVLGEHGAYVDGFRADEESVWGFLGYDSPADIAAQMTDSPIVETIG